MKSLAFPYKFTRAKFLLISTTGIANFLLVKYIKLYLRYSYLNLTQSYVKLSGLIEDVQSSIMKPVAP